MKIGIIGCGLIGKKRAASAVEGGLEIAAISDRNFAKAKTFAEQFGAKACDSAESVINSEADIIVIALPHNQLTLFADEALKAGKHLLIEKPGAHQSSDLLKISKTAEEKNLKIKVGYNHRFHPAIMKAREIVDSGILGDLFFIRGFYGHGGRIGYEKEWRFKKEISGGGELMDQGSHLIDLSRWFLGEIVDSSSCLQNYFWGGEVEDNAFFILKTAKKQTAFLHATWTEWKNSFIFEITGRYGKIAISGLGGSYGTESITLYKMSPKMGPPESVTWSYPFSDFSWKLEMDELLNAIKENRQPLCSVYDAIETLKVIENLYKQAESKN
ncbi:MAG: Gfo/Idh/MocA family oxidoreductase [Elusimicrobiota bacterium]|jgi:predicted dehydrogenase|nr:Gfo/Idh/MocA family oxidoreductase [Elusimicrobiota bacterium]